MASALQQHINRVAAKRATKKAAPKAVSPKQGAKPGKRC